MYPSSAAAAMSSAVMCVMPSRETSPATDARAKGDRRDDRRLGRGVEPVDVGRGVALGVTELLRLGDRGRERQPLLRHAGEHVVGGAVDDSGHAPDALSGQRLAQRPDQRDTARDRSFEQQVDARRGRNLEELFADVREQLLVRGHHRLAGLERGEDQRTRGFDAADHLDDHVDVGRGDDTARVVGEHTGRELDVTLLGEILHRDPRHLEANAGTARDQVGVGVEQAHEGRAHVAASENADSHESVAE